MSQPIIEVCGLSKRYRLGEFSAGSLREEMERAWKRLRRKNGHIKGSSFANDKDESVKDFWALKDISFSVQPGEVVGIIGRNGAGKSTLLKILSRITEPTKGEVIMRGRVASLLEVGTGFHPELSGRENIYLNGAILGMKKNEIDRKFDEIVAFAEVEQFIDTPVKRYSSGMYVRLAFAVAAHLEPEILIIDEVLAVGDMQFQKKCLAKMKDVSLHGRTVIFVSHNIEALLRLCETGVLLCKGELNFVGGISDAVSRYMKQPRTSGVIQNVSSVKRWDGFRLGAKLESFCLTDSEGKPCSGIDFGSPITIRMCVCIQLATEGLRLELGVCHVNGVEVASLISNPIAGAQKLSPGRYQIEFSYSSLRLLPNSFYFRIGLWSESGIEDYVADLGPIEIFSSPSSGEIYAEKLPGMIHAEGVSSVIELQTLVNQTGI